MPMRVHVHNAAGHHPAALIAQIEAGISCAEVALNAVRPLPPNGRWGVPRQSGTPTGPLAGHSDPGWPESRRHRSTRILPGFTDPHAASGSA